MKHHVKRIFESDLDATLDMLDREDAELIRILDIPKGLVAASVCPCCVPEGPLCPAHATERARLMNLRGPAQAQSGPCEPERKDLVVAVPRYAVVYCCHDAAPAKKAVKKAIPVPKKRKA